MTQTLHVGNVAETVTDQQLHDLFPPSGAVVSARVMTDAQTGQGRGFALVEMATFEGGEGAVRPLNGSQAGGRTLCVRPAITRAPVWASDSGQGGANRSHGLGVANGGSRY